ncbi:MAG: histone deacetylase family protein [Deltaproteobacteria bacterium]|nr:MAG: histone deacetylase family protein [Deltaproteobacteria bacterium]
MLEVIYHTDYENDFSPGSLEGPQRIKAILGSLTKYRPFSKPEPASEADLYLVHEPSMVARLRSRRLLMETVLVAVGGALHCARSALVNRPAFGLLRPPGHHADHSDSWGFCYVNNMAIAVRKIRQETDVRWVVIIDLDHHVGDGTQRIFVYDAKVSVVNITAVEREQYLEKAENVLRVIRKADLLAVSMGFDTYERDLGGLLKTEDYRLLGSWLRQTAERLCGGRRFALLEGGYYLPDLGRNVLAFCEGFSGE